MKEKLKVLSVMLMVLSLSLCVVSCSGDDEKESDSIVGIWKYKEATAGEVKTNSAANDSKIGKLITDWAKKDFDSFTYSFAAGGTFTLTDSRETESDTYTFNDGTLKLMWGDPDDYDIYKASVTNGVLIIEKDYTEGCDDLELNELMDAGITDPMEFTVTKATAKIGFSRQ